MHSPFMTGYKIIGIAACLEDNDKIHGNLQVVATSLLETHKKMTGYLCFLSM